jgi:glutamine synthetase adenylyltransferase
MILEKLEKQDEDNHIIDLLEQKQIIAENIVDLTRKIFVTEIKDRKDTNLQNLSKVKALLSQIAEKTEQIQKTEEKIQSLL